MISIDGDVLYGDPDVQDISRQTDVQLADADIQVICDGLGARPRLDLAVVGGARGYTAGERVTLQSALNYPSFVARAEARLIDIAASGGPRTLSVVPVSPNGMVDVEVPDGAEIVMVHRVYDARGRYDETYPVPLTQAVVIIDPRKGSGPRQTPQHAVKRARAFRSMPPAPICVRNAMYSSAPVSWFMPCAVKTLASRQKSSTSKCVT